MTTAIIGTGGIGSAIAHQLASGGEPLRLSSANKESAQALAAQGSVKAPSSCWYSRRLTRALMPSSSRCGSPS